MPEHFQFPVWLKQFVVCCTSLWILGTADTADAHIHVQVSYADNAWRLFIYDFASGEFDPTTTPLHVGHQAFGFVPANAFTNFLGPRGSEIWTLPEIENPSLLFLGIGTTGIAPGTFINNEIQLHLRSVAAPGHFALYNVDPFGTPVMHMNTRDGITAADAITVPAMNGHAHVNWSFSAPGTYCIGFSASARLAGSGASITSAPTNFSFVVQDVPWRPQMAIWTATNGSPFLTLSTTSTGRLCRVWSSPDFKKWDVLTNFPMNSTTQTISVGDFASTNRFFRTALE